MSINPRLAAHLQRDQIAGHEFLTLRLDGSMIPWDKIREEPTEDIDEEQFNTHPRCDQQANAGRGARRDR